MQRSIRGVVVAGVSNALFTPMGYFMAGAWRTGLGFCVAVVVLGILALQLTLWCPPGIFELSRTQWMALRLWAMLPLAAHAAWLASRILTRHSLLLRVGMGLIALVVTLGAALLIPALWPVSIYTEASGSMRPSLGAGDVIAVNGALGVLWSCSAKTG